MEIERMSREEGIIEEIKSGDFTRDEIALTYAFCRESSEKIDWLKVNIAILNRWSLSGLNYIKSKASKLMEEKQRGR